MQVRKKVLGVGAESTTLLVQDNEANGELRVVRRVNVAKWKQEELRTALEFYLTLMQHKLSHFVPIYAVTHSGQYLNITTAYCSKGDLNSYVEDECDAPLRTQQILRWGLFLACAIHELNSHTQLHFYGLELDRIFMTSQTDIIAGLPMLPTHYWQVLRNRQGDGVAVERQYPLETLSSESYYGELTDVWHLGQVLQTLLSAHCHYSARPASVRELIALMMETNYTRRLPIIEVIARMEKLVNSSTHNNSNNITVTPSSTSTSISNKEHHHNGDESNNNKRSKEERSTSSASSQLRSLHAITSTNTNSHSSRETHNKEKQRTPSREPNVADVNSNNRHHHRESSARFERRESANKISRTPSGTSSSPPTALPRRGEHVVEKTNSHTLTPQHSEEEVVSKQQKQRNQNNTKVTDGKVKCVYATRKPSPRRATNKETVNSKENNKNDMPNNISSDKNNNSKTNVANTNSNKASDEIKDKYRSEKLSKQVKESKSIDSNINNNNVPLRNAPQVSSARRFRSTSANNNINSDGNEVKDNGKIKYTTNSTNTNNTLGANEINGAHKHVAHEVFNDSWEQHVLQELEEVQRLNVSTPLPHHHTRNLQALSRHATPTAKLVQISPRESASSHTSNEKSNRLKSITTNDNINKNNTRDNNNIKKSERKNVYEQVNKSWQAHVNEETAHRTPHPLEHNAKENNKVERSQEEQPISITQSYHSSDAEWKRLREMHEARIAQRTQAQKEEQKQRKAQRQQKEEQKENNNIINIISNNDGNETQTEQTKARAHSKETLERIMEWKRQAASNNENGNNNIVNTEEREEQQQQEQHHSKHEKRPNFVVEMRSKPHEEDKAHELRRAEIARHHKRNENIPVTVMLPPHTRADANTSALDKESTSHNNNKENEKPQLARFNTAPEISIQQAKLYNNNNNNNSSSNADKKSNNNSSTSVYSNPAKSESNSQQTSTSQSAHLAKMAVEALNIRAAPVIGNRSKLAVKANNDNSNNNHANKGNNMNNISNNKDNKNVNSVNAEQRSNNEEKEVDKNGNRESEARNKILKNNNNNNNNGKGNTSNKNTLLHSTAPLPQHASPRESRLPQQVNKKEAVWHVTSNPVVKEGKSTTDEAKGKEYKNAAFASPGAPTLPFARNKSGTTHIEKPEQQHEQAKNESVEHEKQQQHEQNTGTLPHHNAPSANHSTHNTSPHSSSSSAIGETRKQTTTALASLEWNVDGLRSSIRSLLHNREMYGNVLATIHRFLDESEEVRSSAHANRQFMANIRRVVADDHIYGAAAPLCAQLVALEGVSRSIHEMQEPEKYIETIPFAEYSKM